MEIYIFVPCFVDQFYPNIGWNMVKVLEYLGFSVIRAPLPACCGQAPHNAGFTREAGKILNNFWRYYQDNDAKIVIPSSSCAGFLKTQSNAYLDFIQSELLGKRVFEFSDFLETHTDISAHNFSYPFQVAYHQSCSALREYPRPDCTKTLLSKVSELELLTVPQADSCCGFGGSFALKFGAISASMASQKLQNIQSTGTHKLLSSDPSCLLHLSSYAQKNNIALEILHTADILAENLPN